MGLISVADICVTDLQRINVEGGDVLHAMRCEEPNRFELGEAYFSFIKPYFVKAWKMHTQMTLNVIVPVGKVKFVFFDEFGKYREEIIGEDRFSRLTVPPRIWFGFQGYHETESLLLNLADIPHDPNEVERQDVHEINYEWTN